MAFDDPRILNKLFGWQVAKRVRSLAETAFASSLERDNDFIRGEIHLAGNKWLCSVRQLSPTLIEGTCTCAVYRREQMLCEHIGLMYLAACGELKSADPSSARKAETGRAGASRAMCCQLTLPENWRSLWEKPSLPVRCEILPEEVADEADFVFQGWLASQGVTNPPPMLVLPSDVRMSFLHALSGHKRIFAGKEAWKIEDQVPLFLLNIQKKEKDSWVLSPHLPQDLAVWHGLFLNSARNILYLPAEKVTPPGWNASEWGSLLSGKPICIRGELVVRSLPALSLHFQMEEAGEKMLELETLLPVFSLSLDGSTGTLRLVVFAEYGKEGDFPLIPSESGRELPRVWRDKTRQGFWRRQVEKEMAFAAMLSRNGFTFTPRGWILSGESEIMEWWMEILPQWERRADCRLELSDSLKRDLSQWARLTPVLVPAKGREDWLEASFQFADGNGAVYPSSEILKLIKSGKKKVKLKNGQTGIIDAEAAEDWTELLSETDVAQSSPGEFRFNDRSLPVFRSLMGEHGLPLSSLSKEGEKMPDWEAVAERVRRECRVSLRPYQEEGVKWCWHQLLRSGGALLGDDMGLGKTLQTLALFVALKAASPKDWNRPSLIVAPASLLHNWALEARKMFPTLDLVVLHGNGREELEIKDIGITTYALLSRDFARHKRANYAFLAFDEASFIRNPDTDAAEALRRIPADYKLALSGTPIENGVRDLWSVFEVVLPGYLGSRKSFCDTYEKPLATTPPDLSVLRRLRHRVCPWILRRTKEEVAPELPPKIISVRWCELRPEHKSLYHSLRQEGLAQISDTRKKQGKDAARMIMLTVLLRLRQLCDDSRLLNLGGKSSTVNSAKMESFLELVEELNDNGHRTLVFSQFTSFLKLAAEELKKKGIKTFLLDGSTRNRGELVEKFNEPSGPPVFLISLKAGGYGLNLQAADTVIHLDPWWNPAVETQATDRAHRIGQLRPVNVYKMICSGTVEEKILALQERKKDILAAAFDEDRPLMSGLNEQEISDLLGIS